MGHLVSRVQMCCTVTSPLVNDRAAPLVFSQPREEVLVPWAPPPGQEGEREVGREGSKQGREGIKEGVMVGKVGS